MLAPPISGPRVVDFGRPLGRVTAWLYNLPEVASTHENLRVPSVSARFATAPVFWNWCRPAPNPALNPAVLGYAVRGRALQLSSVLICSVTSTVATAGTRPGLRTFMQGTATQTYTPCFAAHQFNQEPLQSSAHR